MRYNDFLKFKGIDKKHSQIVQGDKIKWVYLKDNPYKIDTMGFLDFDFPEGVRTFVETYVDRDKAFDSILKNKLESFYQDLSWGSLTLNTHVNNFFFILMTDKRIIDSFIDKYHLGGNIERIKWVSDNESLSAKFINDSQNLVGEIKSKNFQFPVGEFGIYSTSTLSKLLGILENEVMFDVNKEGGIPSKFIIADTSMDISFNLADPQVIPNAPAINKMEGKCRDRIG